MGFRSVAARAVLLSIPGNERRAVDCRLVDHFNYSWHRPFSVNGIKDQMLVKLCVIITQLIFNHGQWFATNLHSRNRIREHMSARAKRTGGINRKETGTANEAFPLHSNTQGIWGQLAFEIRGYALICRVRAKKPGS